MRLAVSNSGSFRFLYVSQEGKVIWHIVNLIKKKLKRFISPILSVSFSIWDLTGSIFNPVKGRFPLNIILFIRSHHYNYLLSMSRSHLKKLSSSTVEKFAFELTKGLGRYVKAWWSTRPQPPGWYDIYANARNSENHSTLPRTVYVCTLNATCTGVLYL